MSLSGKLLRGLKWHKHRNLEGIYHKDILANPHKMEELKFYLDFIKTRDAGKVHKILHKVVILDMNSKQALMDQEAKKLEDESLLLKDKETAREKKAREKAEAKLDIPEEETDEPGAE